MGGPGQRVNHYQARPKESLNGPLSRGDCGADRRLRSQLPYNFLGECLLFVLELIQGKTVDADDEDHVSLFDR